MFFLGLNEPQMIIRVFLGGFNTCNTAVMNMKWNLNHVHGHIQETKIIVEYLVRY